MNPRILDRIALGVAATSLLILGLRPTSERLIDPTAIVVRTPGATSAEARAVADSLGGAAVVELDRGALPATATEIHLVGYGASAGELQRMAGRWIVLHPRALPDGVRDASWDPVVTLGEMVQVRVTVRSPRRATVALVAETGVVDSASTPAGELTTLLLRHAPRATGSALYALRMGARADTFSVLVVPAAPPSLMILSSAPSREWSDLRDWAAAQGGTVALRTTVSRDRSRIDRVNLPASASAGIDRATLARTGVVVTDGRTLVGLSAAGRGVLRSAVRAGLGLIVVLDDAARDPRRIPPSDRAVLVPWATSSAGDLEERQVRPRAHGGVLSPTPIAAEPVVIGGGVFGSVPLLEDGQDGVLAMSMTQGTGRVVGSVVTGAGRWLRGGEPEAFAGYWSTLLHAAARPDPSRSRWEIAGRPLLIDDEVELVRHGPASANALVEGDTVPLSADPLTPGRAVGHWWPRSAGWNRVDDVRVWIGGSASWESWQGAERRRVTERWIAEHRTGMHEGGRIPFRSPWPLWPFFLCFVAASGWLWRMRT
jgi:hypothetical protein